MVCDYLGCYEGQVKQAIMEGSKYEIRALNAGQTGEENKKSEKDDDELILRAFWEGQLAAVMVPAMHPLHA